MIRLRGVSKTYARKIEALRNVDLAIADGEHTVILGANGAGKSTLLRVILGAIPLRRGAVEWAAGARPRIGYAAEHARLLPRVTAGELLGVLPHRERVGEAVAALHLGDVLHRRTEHLSKGEAQRVALAFAFSTNAPLVVLDEPFEGMDPMIRPLGRAFIAASLAAHPRSTLIATTHRLEEVREPFRRVILMDGGRVAKDLSTVEFAELARGSVLVRPIGASADEVRAEVAHLGLPVDDLRIVVGTCAEQPAILAGPFRTRHNALHPLDAELLLQLWLQRSLT
jgi:ABC-type multidrug transport system ATPase subunit